MQYGSARRHLLGVQNSYVAVITSVGPVDRKGMWPLPATREIMRKDYDFANLKGHENPHAR
jgi:hypothetical protein